DIKGVGHIHVLLPTLEYSVPVGSSAVPGLKCTTPCMLLYPIGRAGKTKEVAKAHVDPVGSLFEGKPIPPLYACMRVQELLKSRYEDNKIDIPTADGKTTLG